MTLPRPAAASRVLAAALVFATAVAAVHADSPPRTLTLLGDDLGAWEERSFDGRTRYTLRAAGGQPVLHAQASGAASGLYREREVALGAWPVLRWSWRADAFPGAGDERMRSGDDFVLRVYVIARDPVLFWRTRAVCYVWSASAGRGESWPNPFTDSVWMLVLRGADDARGQWRAERRDVAADFRRLFGEAPQRIDAVAVMTDADQTGRVARGAYRALRFEAARGE